ncbi:hypothetical protein [Algivirga pacifica]|uniref:Uncharacterized protein n=1 Tax=Algivirga pacifica TaxID=1162670 RepID=A0ABP9DL50_9BACT
MQVIRIEKDNLVEGGNTFKVDNCIGFIVSNKGNTNAYLGYADTGSIIYTIEAGKSFAHTLPSGSAFQGDLFVNFENADQGFIEVVKHVVVGQQTSQFDVINKMLLEIQKQIKEKGCS